jgi:molybdenum cofactor cytidylyltransferase
MYDCVLLAAGASSRMRGSEGRALLKALLPFGESTLVETAARAALGAGCRVLLVVGKRGDEVAALFASGSCADARSRLVLVDNPRWEAGMLCSIQAALPRVEGEAFFVALADMPFVGSEAYLALAARRADVGVRRGEAAILASHEGRAGHPALLPSAWIPGILSSGDGDRLRPFLEGRPLVLVETGPSALRDIDTAAEYSAALEARGEGRSIPAGGP